MRAFHPTLIGSFCLALASCGGGPEPEEAPPSDPSGGGEDVIPSPEGWSTMSLEDRSAWMASEVVPRMERLFQEHDAEAYASFSCQTCHGPGASEGEFTMPSNSLPALHPTGSPEQQVMVEDYRPVLVFMYQRVVPTMQTLLGAPDYDEETQEGFSCFACHPHAGDEGSTPLIVLEPQLSGAEATNAD